MKIYSIEENGLYMVFHQTQNNRIRLDHFADYPMPKSAKLVDGKGKLVEYQETGAGSSDHRGRKHCASLPSSWFELIDFKDYRNDTGRKIEVAQGIEGVEVTSHYQFFNGLKTIRAWTEVKNTSKENREIEHVSSFAYFHASKDGSKQWEDKMALHQAHNSWYDEVRWCENTLPELGLNPTYTMASTKRIYEMSMGTWSSADYLPMGCLENKETGTNFLWQIEHNGSWYWEVADFYADLFNQPGKTDMPDLPPADSEIYVLLFGPTEWESAWHKSLKPGCTFTTVPVAVTVITGDFEDAIGDMISYRRKIRRPNEDNESLAIIFNDYMNCLFGDSTTEKLIPLIDAASNAGCEYFVIDCGWYTDKNWWAGVGEWLPSEQRYPGGIDKPIQYIRDKGMIPGLWLEIEVVGYDCPNFDNIPKSWFFKRHGKYVSDTCRYQLDFRNTEVRNYATKVIDRMVNEFGVGYIKMDYNINAGLGTEVNSDSLGDGLLEHNRAYLSWIDSIFEKYPELIIENCGSGGMRMDYAMLSRHSIQSSSDQTDYWLNAVIAATCATAVNPEQCAIWSYPLSGADCEETVVNMVNAMLLRIHQSGHLAELPKDQFNLVKEGLNVYKQIRSNIKTSIPFWPLGMPQFEDDWFMLGLKNNENAYLAVWRKEGSQYQTVNVSKYFKELESAQLIYPSYSDDSIQLNNNGSITISMKNEKSARLFKLTDKR